MSYLAEAINQYQRALLPILAERLAGRSCEIQWRKPYISDFLALTAQGENGPIIQLDPDLSGAQLLRVFLHELGHIRAGHALPDHANHQKAPATWHLTDREGFIAETQPREAQADSWARYWLDFAERSAQGKSITALLAALMTWRPLD